jgi:FkbM family methyltransferase
MSCYVYGAGAYGRLLKRAIEGNGGKVSAFLDAYNHGVELEGVPVLPPVEGDVSVPVWISVALTPANGEVSAIKANLSGLGYSEVYEFSDAIIEYPYFLSFLPSLNRLWMKEGLTSIINENAKAIANVENILKETQSRELFSRILEFRKGLEIESYPWPDGKNEYFTDDVPVLSNLEEVHFVDAGAYIGDTLEDLVKTLDDRNIKLGMSVSFEPDERNFTQLNKKIWLLKEKLPHAQLLALQSAIWSENTILSFSEEGSSSSALSKQTSRSQKLVSATSLDTLLVGCTVNYIKMDIEGAEQRAIDGARHVIKQNRPSLAICVYHTPEDLWEVPLKINEMVDNYAFFLRVHGHTGLSTVLYAIPEERL